MNLQQLNGSGQPVHTFVYTAVIALVITALIWFVAEVRNGYFKWERIHKENPTYTERPMFLVTYSIVERCAMVVWLSYSRKWRWMIKNGIWWRIILNSKAELITKYRDKYMLHELLSWRFVSAGQLVSEVIHRKISLEDLSDWEPRR